MIYLDNAATTWPKPPSVTGKMRELNQIAMGNPGRGSHKLAQTASETVYDCRLEAGKMFGAEPEGVIFTMNATQALNMAIKGLARRGGHILMDNFAHNAMARPVYALEAEGRCTADVYDATGDRAQTLSSLQKHLTPDTCLVLATHQSNICSKKLPIEEIGQFCRSLNLPFVVDGSQSAGHLPIHLPSMGITALCVPGHKGLMGPMGVGMLITDGKYPFETVVEGGAGIRSMEKEMPDTLPERLEAGTLPLPAIAGLAEGIRWVKKTGLEVIHRHDCMLSELFCQRLLGSVPGSAVYGDTAGSVVSFTVDSHSPTEIGAYLNAHGVAVRTGLHCAPLAHRTLNTPDGGTARISFSYMNTVKDVLRVTDLLAVM